MSISFFVFFAYYFHFFARLCYFNLSYYGSFLAKLPLVSLAVGRHVAVSRHGHAVLQMCRLRTQLLQNPAPHSRLGLTNGDMGSWGNRTYAAA